ncbi:MAG: hypothetical protein ABIW46_06165, partial [Acidimicrobiales bacterium]
RWWSPRAHGVTVMTPVGDDRVEVLRGTLAGYGSGAAGPLAAVDGLHLARWAVVDWVQDSPEPSEVRRQAPARLLFSAEFQGRPKACLARTVADLGAAADEVWGHCEGWPGSARPADAVHYLARHRVRSHLNFAAYGRYDVESVRRALDRRRRLLAFVADSEGRTGTDQLRAFRFISTRTISRGV